MIELLNKEIQTQISSDLFFRDKNHSLTMLSWLEILLLDGFSLTFTVTPSNKLVSFVSPFFVATAPQRGLARLYLTFFSAVSAASKLLLMRLLILFATTAASLLLRHCCSSSAADSTPIPRRRKPLRDRLKNGIS